VRTAVADALPAFRPIKDCRPGYKASRPGYWHRRDPLPPKRMYCGFVIQHSSKWRVFGCDVYAGMFPSWSGSYGGSQLANATGLANLRLGSQAVPIEQQHYRYDGSPADAQRAVGRIVNELVRYALPWFEEAEQALVSDDLALFAMRWVAEELRALPADVATQLREAGRLAGQRIDLADYEPLHELKRGLREVAKDSQLPTAQRRGIPGLAWDALLYAQLLKDETAKL
jgi:hypothetical protein